MREEMTEDEEMAEIQAHNQGWWIPPSLRRLFQSRQINEAELILLWRMSAIGGDQCEGCVDTNEQLAEWQGRSPEWVERTLIKLEKRGLIEVKETTKKVKEETMLIKILNS